jgi:hypothetical protein
MEIEYLEVKFRCYEDGKVERYIKDKWKVFNLKPTKDGYIRFQVKLKSILLHRLIYKAFNPEWDIENTKNKIDHINGSKTDNRIENLRSVSQQKNCWNRPNAKGFYLTKNGKYISIICVNYKNICLGTFVTEEQAKNAYLEAKNRLHII